MTLFTVGQVTLNLDMMQRYEVCTHEISADLSKGDIFRLEVIIEFPSSVHTLTKLSDITRFLKKLPDSLIRDRSEKCLRYYYMQSKTYYDAVERNTA